MSDAGFLALGYGIVWVVMGAYVFTLGRRHARLRREVERLERDLGREEGRS
jgi:CcmD family protein